MTKMTPEQIKRANDVYQEAKERIEEAMKNSGYVRRTVYIHPRSSEAFREMVAQLNYEAHMTSLKTLEEAKE